MTTVMDRLSSHLAASYTVERELGAGGMATVYLATDLKHERQVAIKVLHPDLSASVGPERFDREIRLAAKLHHPHILALYDSGEADGLLFYVMPFVQGESLRDRLDREHQLPLEEAIQITLEVADALGYAHFQDIVHRDIKPENILLANGHALVADFGIARAVTSSGEKLTQTGMTLGTPLYMSPEQAAGEKVGPTSDLYSLGCVFYEMLAGQPPFTGANPRAIMARHAVDPVPSLRVVRDTVPEELEEAIQTALAKAPQDRIQTAAQFAALISAPLGSTAIRRSGARSTPGSRIISLAASRRLSTNERIALQRRTSRRRWVWLALLVALLVAGGVLTWRSLSSAGAGSGGLDPRHVAVLYFNNLSGTQELGYLADGLTEGLIGDLSRVGSLEVISRNGVEPYREGAVSRDSIARALAVGSLIEGSVENVGDRVRVTARLVDGPSGAEIDRRSFEEPKGNLLGIRDELVHEVTGFLRTRLGEEVRIREQRAGTKNLHAWILLQEAEKLRKDAERFVLADSINAAEQAFQRADSVAARAAAEDSRWADPDLLEAQIAYRRARLAEDEPKKAVAQIAIGLRHADKALAIVPNDPKGLELRGTLDYFHWLLHVTADPRTAAELLRSARQDLEAAVKADPGLASAHATLSHLYYQFEDVPAAVLAAKRAYEEDAYLSVADVVLYRLFNGSLDLGQFTEASRWCDEGNRRFPQDYRFAECRLDLLVTPSASPDVEQGWRELARLDSLTPEYQRAYEHLYGQLRVGGLLARAGLMDSARSVLRHAQSQMDPKVDPNEDLATVAAYSYLLLDDKDQALTILTRYAAGHPGHFEKGVDLMWWWRSIKGDPRFQALIGSGA